MSADNLLFTAGFVLEIVGMAVAAFGFARTWREFSTGEKFFAPVATQLKRARQQATAAFTALKHRISPRPADVRLVSAHAVLGAVSMSARGTVQWPALPPLKDDPELFTQEVQRRLDDIWQRVLRAQEAADENARTAEKRSDQIVQSLDTRITAIEVTAQKVAIGGLRQQSIGWSLVLIGFVLQGWAQFLQNGEKAPVPPRPTISFDTSSQTSIGDLPQPSAGRASLN